MGFPSLIPSGQASLLAAFLFLVLLLLVSSGCGGSEEPAYANTAGEGAGADSAAVTDSARGPDTLSAEQPTAEAGKKKGLLQRLLRRGEEEADDEEESVPVEVVAVEVRDVSSYLGATATLEPEKRAEILAKVGGEIERILVEEGARVLEGEVVAVLDDARPAVALEEAAARARALKADLERARALHEQELYSDKDLRDAESQYEQAEAQQKAAQLDVDYARIRAPFSGTIGQRLVDPGQTVAVGTPLFTVVDTEPLLACVHLPEKEALQIAPGQEVRIIPDTDRDREFRGRVLRIAPVVDSRTGTVKITCEVKGDASALRPGSFVRVRVETDVHEDVLVIPKRALAPEGTENYVYRAEGDTVVKIPVTTGYADDILVEVTEGLIAGDQIVTVGQGALKPGSRIRVVGGDEGGPEGPDSAEKPAQ